MKKYNMDSHSNGKSFSLLLQLQQNLSKGIDCRVSTANPNKTKRDFQYMTGCELKLELITNETVVYKASLLN